MVKILKELFGEAGDLSMMRLLCFMSLIMGCYLAIIGKNDCVTIFVSSAFSGKLLQKGVENWSQRGPNTNKN